MPVIKGWAPNSYLKVFLMNAFCGAIIACVAVEVRDLLNDPTTMLYKLMNDILPGGSVSRFQKLYITLITAFLAAFLVYHILHFLFGYGRGMMGDVHRIYNYW